MSNQELKHYGVLGMKWGISRSKEVRGVKKAYKERERKIDDNFHKYVEGALATDKQLRTDRKQAIKDAKRNGGREAVKGVKSEYEKKLQALSDSFDKKMDKFGRDYDASKKTFKNERAVARNKAADRLFRDGDTARNHRIANMNLGKALLQTFLMGSYGAKKYNQYRAKDQGRLKSGVKGWLWGAGNGIGYQIPTSVSNGRFASNYTKDVVNNNPQLRKIKDDIKNSPQVRKAQDKVNEYKSKLKKKVSR
jgi:hypothetical protein|nr:MAG TPA: hypothetical protein [Caudoviricetes sp.]